jgi:hypothetical protein
VAAGLSREGLTCELLPFAPGFAAPGVQVAATWLLATDAGSGSGAALRAQVGHWLQEHSTKTPDGHASPGHASPGPLVAGDLAHLGEGQPALPDR